MSTDVEKIRQGMLVLHEFWANFIEVGIASFLLYQSLGIAFLAPILIAAVDVGLAAGLASFVSIHSLSQLMTEYTIMISISGTNSPSYTVHDLLTRLTR